MMRSAAGLDTSNGGTSCRIVGFMRQYAASNSVWSSSGWKNPRSALAAGATRVPMSQSQVPAAARESGVRVGGGGRPVTVPVL